MGGGQGMMLGELGAWLGVGAGAVYRQARSGTERVGLVLRGARGRGGRGG